MKLLLTSNGLANDAIVQALTELTEQPFAALSVAFVPTASTLEESDKSWLIDDLSRFRAQGFASIDIVDISAVPASLAKRRLEKAQLIVFGGGDTYYLLDAIEQCGTHDYFKSLFEERTYVGISAGSMLANPHPAVSSESSIWGGIGGGQDPWRQALDLVDFYFRPHLGSSDFPCSQLEALRPVARSLPKRLYGVDDESALKVIDGDVEIVGTGRVLEFEPD